MHASACSWSGGKDSALALWRSVRDGRRVGHLVTVLDESGTRSRSHGLPLEVLEAQARVLGLALITRAATWDNYTEAFEDALVEATARGCESCIFGDIDGEEHRTWCRQVCASAGMQASHPLWNEPRRGLVEEIITSDHRVVVCVVRLARLDRVFLGRQLTFGLAGELEHAGIDICGENGEFHTVVTDGPLFRAPLQVKSTGIYRAGGCAGLTLALTRS